MLNEDTSTGVHNIVQAVTKAAVSIAYVLIVYSKLGVTDTRITLQADDGAGNGATATFDISGVAAVTPVGLGTPFTNLASNVLNIGNGWIKCTFQFKSNTTTTLNITIGDDNGSGGAAASVSYTGVVGHGMYVALPQLN